MQQVSGAILLRHRWGQHLARFFQLGVNLRQLASRGIFQGYDAISNVLWSTNLLI
jgi:hypothetical protein